MTEHTALLACIDHTRLQDDDNTPAVAAFCEQAVTPWGNAAAVCVYPEYIATAATVLSGTDVAIATVVNFPDGNLAPATVLQHIDQALAQGASEIDMVYPYHQAMQPPWDEALDFVAQCKQHCQHHCLKVILETGQWPTPAAIEAISKALLDTGIDFLKTSTGKTQPGATLSAATAMLQALQSQRHTGFKAAGGIQTVADALDYWHLAQQICGANWPNPHTFRIGSSRLLAELINSVYDRIR